MASVRSAAFFGIQSPPFPFSISHCFTVTVDSNLWFWIWTYPEVLWIAALKWVFWNDTMTICLSHAKFVYRKTPPNVALFEAFQSSFCGESFWAMKNSGQVPSPSAHAWQSRYIQKPFPLFPTNFLWNRSFWQLCFKFSGWNCQISTLDACHPPPASWGLKLVIWLSGSRWGLEIYHVGDLVKSLDLPWRIWFLGVNLIQKIFKLRSFMSDLNSKPNKWI